MSLFRKPTKRIQRRVFGCDDDEEEGDPEPPPPPIISKEKKENRPAKNIPQLSFADEEDEGEVFKVKKSTHSKRWARRKEKEKQKPSDGDSKPEINSWPEDEQPSNNEEQQLGKTSRKLSLEGLILSGREALAADGAGDISDSEEEQDEDEDTGGFPRYRAESVRAALAAAAAPGHIPDAALIHAARKTRQQARELGGGDFIPLRTDSGTKAGSGSRLIHDDGSGDDEEEGRLLVRGLELPSDMPKRDAEAVSDVEMDSETEQWEEQQMQKAVFANTDIGMDVGLDVPPPPPRLEDAPPHLRSLSAPGDPPPATAAALLQALTNRLQDLKMSRDAMSSRGEELRARLLVSVRTRDSRKARASPLDAAYRRAQAARGYLTDLVECLDEKMPELETLEARALALHRRRCEYLQERRRADVRDQAQDVLALTGRPGSVRPPDSEDKIRRTAEREGRRRTRRLKRESGLTAHHHREGDSSDDDLPPDELQHDRLEREAIRRLCMSLFSDALPAWRSVRGVCARLSRWRRTDPVLYHDAYVADCLPRLLAPYVRHQLILWNPLADEDNEDYERMDWYNCLMMYGVKSEKVSSDSDESEMNGVDVSEDELSLVSEEGVADDPDLMLVPTILQRVVLPKLTELVESAWDPMQVRACVRLRGLLLRAVSIPRAESELRTLAAAVRVRLHTAVGTDVFLPAQVSEGAGAAFWRRCLGAGVRLLRAVLALCPPPDVLQADPIALMLIGTLCTAAGAAPAPSSASAAAALSSSLPRPPSTLRAPALRRLAALAQRALDNLQKDNPLHLKALEQARGVLAEARAELSRE